MDGEWPKARQSYDNDGPSEEELAAMRKDGPPDPYGMTYISFVILGFGLLVPWNTIISSIDFFNILFPGDSIEFLYSVSYQSTNLVGLCFVLAFGTKFSFRVRIIPGFIMFMVLLGLMPFIHSKTISVLFCGLLGLMDSIVQGSLFGLAGMFSPRYTAGLMAGQGTAGLVVGILRVISKAALPTDVTGTKESTYIYFGTSLFVVLLGILSYLFVLERSPVYHHFMNLAGKPITSANVEPLLPGHASSTHKYGHSSSQAKQPPPNSALRINCNENEDEVPNPEGAASKHDYHRIWSLVYPLAFSCAMVFFVTLSLFPGITSELTSSDKHLNLNSPTNPDGTGWFPIIMITVFDLGDQIGRTLPNWPVCVVLKQRGVVISTVLRLVFFPLFILAARHQVIDGDIWCYIIMLAFSISNGYLGTLSMMYATDAVPLEDKEHTGTLMVFFLTIGLTSGVWTGIGLKTFV